MLKPTLLINFLATTLIASAPLFADTNKTTAQPNSTQTITTPSITTSAVLEHYASLAHANYSDALTAAQALQKAIQQFIATPSDETLQAAKTAWLAARVPYSQTEVFRFGNPNVDAWEGQVNAWPLDEGLIDYVQTDAYAHEDGNAFANTNIIAASEPITPELLRSYQEKGGSEANVATGYHAIEFLLWGQDLNQDPKNAGQRPYTDYLVGKACTHGHCERRAEYLKTVTDLLVTDLQTMVDDWREGQSNYRKTLLALDPQEALRRILLGMGSLSLGELAGQRINVALLAHSQEDEHSCFSDNTHDDILQNMKGVQNVFTGHYTRLDGTVLAGASLAQLTAVSDAKIENDLTTALANSIQQAQQIVQTAQAGQPFDQQILPINPELNKMLKSVIEALRTQTVHIETVATILGVNLNPEPLAVVK